MSTKSGPLLYRVAKAVVGRAVRRVYDIKLEGADRVPEGASILAANHRSFMDSIFMASVARPRLAASSSALCAPAPSPSFSSTPVNCS